MSMQDRPARPGRTKPVPTADAGVDPLDYRPGPTTPPATAAETAPPAEPTKVQVQTPTTKAEQTTPTTPPSTPPGGPQATVQLGVNVDPGIAQLVLQVKARTGLSKRVIVEKAIRETWAS
jgi:hypothetical protein